MLGTWELRAHSSMLEPTSFCRPTCRPSIRAMRARLLCSRYEGEMECETGERRLSTWWAREKGAACTALSALLTSSVLSTSHVCMKAAISLLICLSRHFLAHLPFAVSWTGLGQVVARGARARPRVHARASSRVHLARHGRPQGRGWGS